MLRSGVPRRIKVETGATDGQFTVLKSGEIKDGDQLITDAVARSG
jgi:HlyD family secretion protein